jgi:hypothetical protein
MSLQRFDDTRVDLDDAAPSCSLRFREDGLTAGDHDRSDDRYPAPLQVDRLLRQPERLPPTEPRRHHEGPTERATREPGADNWQTGVAVTTRARSIDERTLNG